MTKRFIIPTILIGLLLALSSCDDGKQTSSLPDQPFKLPDGSTAYPMGSIVTPIDTKEARDNAHLIIWPVELVRWFYSTPELDGVAANLIPISKVIISDESNFAVSRLSQSAFNDDPQIVLYVIEPNANASANRLEQMTVNYMGRETSIRSVHGPFAAPQEVLNGMISDDPKWKKLSRWVVIVDIDKYEIEGDELSIDLDIEYLDQASKKIKDKIIGTTRARSFIPSKWPPNDLAE